MNANFRPFLLTSAYPRSNSLKHPRDEAREGMRWLWQLREIPRNEYNSICTLRRENVTIKSEIAINQWNPYTPENGKLPYEIKQMFAFNKYFIWAFYVYYRCPFYYIRLSNLFDENANYFVQK